MSCPPAWRLAAAASDEDAEAAAHGERCARCAIELADQRAVVALAHRAPAPSLSAALRDQLAAEVMASDAVPPSRRATWLSIGAAGLAAAAAIAIVSTRAEVELVPPPPQLTVAAPAPPSPPMVEPAAPPRPLDTIPLHDGKLAIETRGRGPVTVIAHGVTVAIASGRAELAARAGVIVAVRVFAGSVELEDRGKRIVVMAGDVWIRPEPKPKMQPPKIPPAEPASSLALFRTGWEALRAAREREALTAFDRVTDPVIREDALFWAAVAADRLGDRAGAARRLRTFLDQFPGSPRAEDARGLLAQLAPP